jgi:hypothetical protein
MPPIGLLATTNRMFISHLMWCLVASWQSHKELCDGVVALATEVQSDQLLTNLIRRKFAIKCTTGVLLHRVLCHSVHWYDLPFLIVPDASLLIKL